jgi:phosphoribosyl 1,2-cyclic phosphodiesterase
MSQPQDGTFRATCLLTHLHWDHTQGLPFFTPMLKPGAELDVYAPAQDDGRSVAEVFGSTIHPPLFPVTLDQFPGTFRFHDCDDTEFDVGNVHVMSRFVPHVGPHSATGSSGKVAASPTSATTSSRTTGRCGRARVRSSWPPVWTSSSTTRSTRRTSSR